MAEVNRLLKVLVLISFVTQGRGQDEGSFGVLHVEGTEESQDFCIAYTTKWSRKNLPVELDLTPKYELVEAKPRLLCTQAQDPSEMRGAAVAIQRGNCTLLQKGIYAQASGAEVVIIVSNDTLFTPDGNSTSEFSIPMAVISKDDWVALKNKDFGEDVKVQMYAPPTDNIDGNLAILWVLAVSTVAVGAYWAGVSNKKAVRGTLRDSAASANFPHDTSQENDDASLEVTPLMVVIFVILICGTLLLLFYFYNYLVYVVIVLFCLAACNGFYECMRPIVLWLPLGDCEVPVNRIPWLKNPPQIRIILLIAFSIAMSVWWGVERNKRRQYGPSG